MQADGSDDEPRVGFQEDIKTDRCTFPCEVILTFQNGLLVRRGQKIGGTRRLIALKELTVAALESQDVVRVVGGQYF